MNFQVGDTIVHRSYGPGKILKMDEKRLSGRTDLYYVVQVKDLTLWVPVRDSSESSLRLLTPAKEFEKLFAILSGSGEPLSANRIERKTQLIEQMQSGSLEAICRVIRDLTNYKRTKKMSDSDASILERARDFLLTEWKLSLSVPLAQADQKLKQLLGENPSPR
ncbi:MAG: CarD family transcriptional regulator [Chloroflexota bacterium]